jgi:ketosteroid isomerase-like protein
VSGEPSPEVADLVARLFAAVEARDATALARVVHPDVVWSDPVELPGAGTVCGPKAVIGRFLELDESFDGLTFTQGEIVQSGHRLLVQIRAAGRGTGSGIDVDTEFFALYELREGKVATQVSFFDRAEAERALRR